MKKLPECFAIEVDRTNSFWEKFKEWLRSEKNEYTVSGTYFARRGVFCWVIRAASLSKVGATKRITLEEWDKLVNGFQLPEKWRVKNCRSSHNWTKENINGDIVTFDEYDYGDKYLCINTKEKGYARYIFLEPSEKGFTEYEEITFEQFKKYVLKEPKMQEFEAPEGSLVVSPLVGKKDNLSLFNKWFEDTYQDKGYLTFVEGSDWVRQCLDSITDLKPKVISDGKGQSGVDWTSNTNSRAYKKFVRGDVHLPSLIDEINSYTLEPEERYFAGIDPCNGSDSLAVNIFTNPLTTDECFEKVYTIEDLSEGRVAVVNDGNIDELTTVLKAAFPDDNNKQGLDATYFERSSFAPYRWTSYDSNPHSNTQSVKEFIKQLKTENMNDSRFPFKITSSQMQELFSSIQGNCSWRAELHEIYGKAVLAKEDILVDEDIYKRARKDANKYQNELLDKIFGKDEEFRVGEWVTVEKYVSKDVLGRDNYEIGETFQISRIENSGDSEIRKWIHSERRKQISVNSLRKATPEEIAKAQCPYEDGELCFVADDITSSDGKTWELRYATGRVNQFGNPLFYRNQKKNPNSCYLDWKYHKSAKGVELPKD